VVLVEDFHGILVIDVVGPAPPWRGRGYRASPNAAFTAARSTAPSAVRGSASVNATA
jgi:hypothetical protein